MALEVGNAIFTILIDYIFGVYRLHFWWLAKPISWKYDTPIDYKIGVQQTSVFWKGKSLV
jgi:hypothetical protein